MTAKGGRRERPRMQELPPGERPYERAERFGVRALTDAELLALILRSGDRHLNALDLAYALLTLPGHEEGLERFNHISVEELRALPGIGRIKSLQLLAAVELGRRTSQSQPDRSAQLSSPEQVAAVVGPDMRGLANEQLRVLLLDAKNRLIRSARVSEGGLASLMIDPRDVFREAIRANAAGLILVHNHPSGDPSPSAQDIKATEALLAASRLLGVRLQDHMIIGHEGYVSLREQTTLWRQPDRITGGQ
ncbi:MAG: DNA repair protein RadC [Bacillota bacterium]|nr:DNA repair protein RadC [Bacillota bacterium]